MAACPPLTDAIAERSSPKPKAWRAQPGESGALRKRPEGERTKCTTQATEGRRSGKRVRRIKIMLNNVRVDSVLEAVVLAYVMARTSSVVVFEFVVTLCVKEFVFSVAGTVFFFIGFFRFFCPVFHENGPGTSSSE